MSSNGIQRLADVRMADVAAVGGKAAGLGELFAIDARVPDGVVLTANGASLPPDRRATLIREALEGLGRRFAVRSSGIGEDGVEHSFAGMFETVLDVGRDDIGPAVERVLASAAGVRTAGYTDAGPARMAVIVQRMVDPVAAGVALTADPVSGDRACCVVTAVRGLGERLVSGQAAGDEWVVRDGNARARRRPRRRSTSPRHGTSPRRRAASPRCVARHRTSSGRSTGTGRCGCSRPAR